METELKKQFDDMGIVLKPEILEKCMELTIEYDISDATEFVEQWMAFSLSNLNGADPTLQLLTEFDRKVLHMHKTNNTSFKKKSSNVVTINTNERDASSLDSNPLAMYGIADDDVVDEYMNETVENNLMHTPKAKAVLPRTPARKGAILFSPASYSPISSAMRTPGGSSKSGDIVYTFGNPKLLANAEWAVKAPVAFPVKQLLVYKGESLNTTKLQFMFDTLANRTEIALDRVLDIGEGLIQKAFADEEDEFDWYQLDKGTQDVIKVVGTIHSDYDGPLDVNSTVLVVPDKYNYRYLNLKFVKAKSVGIFPGQIVIAVGTNPQRDMFVVEELLTERITAPAPALKLKHEISFVVAAGPFTPSDDIIYEPLNELMKYLKDHKPHVLILTGPYVEASHSVISAHNTLAESFDAFFEKFVAGIMEFVDTNTTVLMVSSQQDANAFPIYPTPPNELRKTYPHLHMLPDPSLVEIAGITIGITSTDVVDHLMCTELAANSGDKVKRVVNYLFNQGTFYPLTPPPVEDFCYDSVLAQKFTSLNQTPNVLILPSKQKNFLRAVNGCLAINPGRIADEKCGTFARFFMTPPPPAATTEETTTNLFNCVGCQIRKI